MTSGNAVGEEGLSCML